MTRALANHLSSKGSRARLRSSTLRGAGRLLDLGGTFREDTVQSILDRRKARKSDTERIAAAWQRVGTYLNNAMLRFEAEHRGHE